MSQLNIYSKHYDTNGMPKVSVVDFSGNSATDEFATLNITGNGVDIVIFLDNLEAAAEVGELIQNAAQAAMDKRAEKQMEMLAGMTEATQ